MNIKVIQFVIMTQEEVQKTTMTKLEVAATKFAERNHSWLKDALPTLAAAKSFIKCAEWGNANLWHDAQGDDLPEIDREVIVLLDNGKVCFGHRPYKKGYLGKSYVTGNFYTHTYGKGGWNIPDVRWWLDCSLPNLVEEK